MPENERDEQLRTSLYRRLREKLDIGDELSDEDILNIIDEIIISESRKIYISTDFKLSLRQELFNSVRRLGLLQELVDDEDITEIMVNGSQLIFYEKNGRIIRWEKKFRSKEELENIIRQIASRSGRYVNESSPIVDARLTDGSRVNVVLDPVAIDGPILTIRKFPKESITMEDLIKWKSLSSEAAIYLKSLVMAGYNIFISGATSTGKTTFLNVLADYIPKSERIITIEDSAELQIKGASNLVRMEARITGSKDAGDISIRDLIKTSLRMRPDRIIVGEVRGAEALDMVQAMNTGHDGSISTGHANSPEDMLSRIETMILMGSDMPLAAIRKQIASSIDIIIQLGRLRDRSRRVIEICELLGCTDEGYELNTLFSFREYGSDRAEVVGELKRSGSHLKDRRKLKAAALDSSDL